LGAHTEIDVEDPPSPCVPDRLTVPSTRVLVVDDHGIVRAGIATLLEIDGSIKVVGCAGTGEEAVQATCRLKPDVVVMDLMLPGLNGIEATELILAQAPGTRVIVLSSSKTPGHVQRALRAGARGYVLKSAEGADLLHAIEAVMAGDQFISPPITGLSGISKLLGAQEISFGLLSIRERDVLRRVVAGYTSADIGRQLSLSPKTIETYRGRLMVKLGVRDRAALIRLSMNFEVPTV
jgi:DNA-binding NarL/FixJ family response regulator